jgi:hypothetical protein
MDANGRGDRGPVVQRVSRLGKDFRVRPMPCLCCCAFHRLSPCGDLPSARAVSL